MTLACKERIEPGPAANLGHRSANFFLLAILMQEVQASPDVIGELGVLSTLVWAHSLRYRVATGAIDAA